MVRSVAYSPDGRYIISGSDDDTIRIWNAEIGAPVGNPLDGHTSSVRSFAYSPNGRRITSGSGDSTIRTWYTEADTAAGKSLGEHSYSFQSIAYSSNGKHIVSGSYGSTTVLDAFSYDLIRSSPCSPTHPGFCAKPGKDGWVKDSEGGLLYWVPHDCRAGLNSPAVMTIPLTSRSRSHLGHSKRGPLRPC